MPPRRKRTRSADVATAEVSGGRAGADDRGIRLTAWLQERGCDLDGLEIRPDADGGLGVFATKTLPAMSAIGVLPRAVVLDPRDALSSPIAQRALALGASPPFALWLSLAKGLRDSTDPFHGYLSTLPEAPDPCAWSCEERGLLEGTPLSKQVISQRSLLRAEFDRVVPSIAKQISLEIAFDDLIWARGVHQSRCFPLELAEALSAGRGVTISNGGKQPPVLEWAPSAHKGGGRRGAGDRGGEGKACGAKESAALGDSTGCSTATPGMIAGTLGCMLPLLDMLQHEPGKRITWDASEGAMSFRYPTAVTSGAQLYNNYGPKDSGSMLLTYGFALEQNEMDKVEGLYLGCRGGGSGGGDGAALKAARLEALCEFEIEHRVREDGSLLIGPLSLGGEVDEDDEENGVLSTPLLQALGVIGMDDGDEAPQISLNELDLLGGTLEGRLADLAPSEEADLATLGSVPQSLTARRARYVAAYRGGQRRVLRAAIAQALAMAEGAGEEEVCAEEAELSVT